MQSVQCTYYKHGVLQRMQRLIITLLAFLRDRVAREHGLSTLLMIAGGAIDITLIRSDGKANWGGMDLEQGRKDEWMPRRAQICRLILLIQNEIRVVPRREKMSRPFLSFSVYSVRS